MGEQEINIDWIVPQFFGIAKVIIREDVDPIIRHGFWINVENIKTEKELKSQTKKIDSHLRHFCRIRWEAQKNGFIGQVTEEFQGRKRRGNWSITLSGLEGFEQDMIAYN